MANVPQDLTLKAAETVISFLATHIASLQNEYAAAVVAPLPNGDPFKCASFTQFLDFNLARAAVLLVCFGSLGLMLLLGALTFWACRAVEKFCVDFPRAQ